MNESVLTYLTFLKTYNSLVLSRSLIKILIVMGWTVFPKDMMKPYSLYL